MKNWTDSPQTYELARAIPAKFIQQAPSGKHGTFIPHYVIEQVIIATVGHFDWELKETLYGPVPAMGDQKPSTRDMLTGAIYRMTVTVDGHRVVIEEAGSADAPSSEWNDAERLKKASSDALKRCAMRLGVGLHLWCKKRHEFFLPTVLRTDDADHTADDTDPVVVAVEDDEDI